ncbi:MAG: glycosyltransferase family 39 protein, partial [Planctomycetota bacterium]
MAASRTRRPRWTRWALGGVIVLAVASRLGVTAHLWDPDRTAMEYGNIAGHLVEGRGFAISLNHWGWYDPPVMTTRWMMPFYPVLLAGSKLLTPERPRWYLEVYILQSLLAGAIAWLLYRLGSRLYGAGAGLAAAALFCVVPNLAYYAARPHPLTWELTALLLALVACRAYLAGGKRRYLVGCALAALWAIYIRSAGVLLVPLMVALLVVVGRDWRRALRASALLVGIVALGVAP